jgi:hypothetical protein
MNPDPAVVRERAFDADSDLIRHCSAVVRDHARRHGWSKRQTNDVIRSLRLLGVLQDTPGAKIRATDVLQLPRYDGNITSTLDVLAAAGMLVDDRLSHVERYFAAKTERLPGPMRAQLEVWLEVMLNGSGRAPRQRSRDPQTARIHILGITPILTAWADAGHLSLAEITPQQVALVAFHALTAGQLARLQVTDIVDSRLTLSGREIPLAGPVKVRLAAWLDYRNRTWPASINPHLFVGRRSAPRLTPVGKQFPWTRTDLRPQALREDRILQEIHATGGDVRRICDLFGLNIETAVRYALTLGHPDLEQNPPTGLSTPMDKPPSKTVD